MKSLPFCFFPFFFFFLFFSFLSTWFLLFPDFFSQRFFSSLFFGVFYIAKYIPLSAVSLLFLFAFFYLVAFPNTFLFFLFIFPTIFPFSKILFWSLRDYCWIYFSFNLIMELPWVMCLTISTRFLLSTRKHRLWH